MSCGGCRGRAYTPQRQAPASIAAPPCRDMEALGDALPVVVAGTDLIVLHSGLRMNAARTVAVLGCGSIYASTLAQTELTMAGIVTDNVRGPRFFSALGPTITTLGRVKTAIAASQESR